MKFLALNVDFSTLSSDFLDSKKPAHPGDKKGYPSKKVFIYPGLAVDIDIDIHISMCRYKI